MQSSGKKPAIFDEVQQALQNIRFGSVEIYVQDGVVTQVTVRNIKKTKFEIPKEAKAAIDKAKSK
jgi:hypothetical protein